MSCDAERQDELCSMGLISSPLRHTLKEVRYSHHEVADAIK